MVHVTRDAVEAQYRVVQSIHRRIDQLANRLERIETRIDAKYGVSNAPPADSQLAFELACACARVETAQRASYVAAAHYRAMLAELAAQSV